MVAHTSSANTLQSKDVSDRIIVTPAYCTNYTSEIMLQYTSAMCNKPSVFQYWVTITESRNTLSNMIQAYNIHVAKDVNNGLELNLVSHC